MYDFDLTVTRYLNVKANICQVQNHAKIWYLQTNKIMYLIKVGDMSIFRGVTRALSQYYQMSQQIKYKEKRINWLI